MSEKSDRVFFNVHVLFLSLLLLFFHPIKFALANTGEIYSMDIKISGTVVANGSCVFNQTGTATVDFKEVKLKGTENNNVELDGDYIQPLDAQLSCSGDTAGVLRMKLSSASGSYETYNGIQVLPTDKGIIGIQLLVDGAAKNMGEEFTIDPNNPPTLQAQLVQVSTTNSNNVVSGDEFTASGTLTVAFN